MLEVSPMDGQTLTEALHAHGINIRYIGKVEYVLFNASVIVVCGMHLVKKKIYIYVQVIKLRICLACSDSYHFTVSSGSWRYKTFTSFMGSLFQWDCCQVCKAHYQGDWWCCIISLAVVIHIYVFLSFGVILMFVFAFVNAFWMHQLCIIFNYSLYIKLYQVCDSRLFCFILFEHRQVSVVQWSAKYCSSVWCTIKIDWSKSKNFPLWIDEWFSIGTPVVGCSERYRGSWSGASNLTFLQLLLWKYSFHWCKGCF